MAAPSREESLQVPVWLTRVDIAIQTKKAVLFEISGGDFHFSSSAISSKDLSHHHGSAHSWKSLSTQIPASTPDVLEVLVSARKKKTSHKSKILAKGCISKRDLLINHSPLADDHEKRPSQGVDVPMSNGHGLAKVTVYPLVNSGVAWMVLFKLDSTKGLFELERLCVQRLDAQLVVYLSKEVVSCLQEALSHWSASKPTILPKSRKGKTKAAFLALTASVEASETIFRIWSYLSSSSKLKPLLIRGHSGPALALMLRINSPRVLALLELMKPLMSSGSNDLKYMIGPIIDLLAKAVSKALTKKQSTKYNQIAGFCFQLIRYLDLKYLKALMATQLPNIISQILLDGSVAPLLDHSFDTIKFLGTDSKAELSSSHLFDALRTLSESNFPPQLRLKGIYLLSKFSMLPVESASSLIQKLAFSLLDEPDFSIRMRGITQLSAILYSFDEHTLHSTLCKPELVEALLEVLSYQSANQKLIFTLINAKLSHDVLLKANFLRHFKALLSAANPDWTTLSFFLNVFVSLSNASFASLNDEDLRKTCLELFVEDPALKSNNSTLSDLPSLPPSLLGSSEKIPVVSVVEESFPPIEGEEETKEEVTRKISNSSSSSASSGLPSPRSDALTSDTIVIALVDKLPEEAKSSGPPLMPVRNLFFTSMNTVDTSPVELTLIFLIFLLATKPPPMHPPPFWSPPSRVKYADSFSRLFSSFPDTFNIIKETVELDLWNAMFQQGNKEMRFLIYIFLTRLPTPLLVFLVHSKNFIADSYRNLGISSYLRSYPKSISVASRFALFNAVTRLSSIGLPNIFGFGLTLGKLAQLTLVHLTVPTDWWLVTKLLDSLLPHHAALRNFVRVLSNKSERSELPGINCTLLPWLSEAIERIIGKDPIQEPSIFHLLNLARSSVFSRLNCVIFDTDADDAITQPMKSQWQVFASYGLIDESLPVFSPYKHIFDTGEHSLWTRMGFWMPPKLVPNESPKIEWFDLPDDDDVTSFGSESSSVELSSDSSSDVSSDESEEDETDTSDSGSVSSSSSTSSSHSHQGSENSRLPTSVPISSLTHSEESDSDSIGSFHHTSIDHESDLDEEDDMPFIGDEFDQMRGRIRDWSPPTSTSSISSTSSTSDSDSDVSDDDSGSLTSDYSDDESTDESSAADSESVPSDDSLSISAGDDAFSLDSDQSDETTVSSASVGSIIFVNDTSPIDFPPFVRFAVLLPRALACLTTPHLIRMSKMIQTVVELVSPLVVSQLPADDTKLPIWVDRDDPATHFLSYCSQILHRPLIESLTQGIRISPIMWILATQYNNQMEVPLLTNLRFLRALRLKDPKTDNVYIQKVCSLSIPDDGLSLSARWSENPLIGPKLTSADTSPSLDETLEKRSIILSSDDLRDDQLIIESGEESLLLFPLSNRDQVYLELRSEALAPSPIPVPDYMLTETSLRALVHYAETLFDKSPPKTVNNALRRFDAERLYAWSLLFWALKSVTTEKQVDAIRPRLQSMVYDSNSHRWRSGFDYKSLICLLLVAVSKPLGPDICSLADCFSDAHFPISPAILDFWSVYEHYTVNDSRDIYYSYFDMFGQRMTNKKKKHLLLRTDKQALRSLSISHLQLLGSMISPAINQQHLKKYDYRSPGYIGGRAIIASDGILALLQSALEADSSLSYLVKSPMAALSALNSRGSSTPWASGQFIPPFRLKTPDAAPPMPISTSDAFTPGHLHILLLIERLFALGRIICKCASLYPPLLSVYTKRYFFYPSLSAMESILEDDSSPLKWFNYPLLLMDRSTWIDCGLDDSLGDDNLFFQLRETVIRSQAAEIVANLESILASEWVEHYAMLALLVGLGDQYMEAETVIASHALRHPESLLNQRAFASFMRRHPVSAFSLLPPLLECENLFITKFSQTPSVSWPLLSQLPLLPLTSLLEASPSISAQILGNLTQSDLAIWANDVIRRIDFLEPVVRASGITAGNLGTKAVLDIAKLSKSKSTHMWVDPRTLAKFISQFDASFTSTSVPMLSMVMHCPSIIVSWLTTDGAMDLMKKELEKPKPRNNALSLNIITSRYLLLLASMPRDLLRLDLFEMAWKRLDWHDWSLQNGKWAYEVATALILMKQVGLPVWKEYVKEWFEWMEMKWFNLVWPPRRVIYVNPLFYHILLALDLVVLSETHILEMPTLISSIPDQEPESRKKKPKKREEVGIALQKAIRNPIPYYIVPSDPNFQFVQFDYGYLLPPSKGPVHVIMKAPIKAGYGNDSLLSSDPPTRIYFEMLHMMRPSIETTPVACIGLASEAALDLLKRNNQNARVGDVPGSWCVDVSPLGLHTRSHGFLDPVYQYHRTISPKNNPNAGAKAFGADWDNPSRRWRISIHLRQNWLEFRDSSRMAIIRDIDFTQPLYLVISYESPAFASLGRGSSSLALDAEELQAQYPFEALPLPLPTKRPSKKAHSTPKFSASPQASSSTAISSATHEPLDLEPKKRKKKGKKRKETS